MGSRKLHRLVLLWLALVSLLGFGHLLRPGAVPYSVDSDIIGYHLGLKWHLFRSWTTHHQVPLWAPHQFSGLPALTNPQALYTYPLDFLFYLMPPTAAVGPTLFLHFALMALGFYALGKTLQLSLPARAVMLTAGLFNFKAVLAAYAGWLAVLPMLTLLPWFLAAAISVAERPRPGIALGLGLAGALLLHGGAPQLIYYFLLLLVPYLVYRFVKLLRAGPPGAARSLLVACTAALLLSVGLSLYLWLPMLADLPLVTRQAADYPHFQGQPIGLAHMATFLLPEHLGTPLDRSRWGLWGEDAYFGLLPFLLALVGGALGRRPVERFLGLAFLLSVVFALEGPSRLLYEWLPGFRLFRLPGRFLFLTAIFGIALAGVGTERLGALLRGRVRPVVLWGALLGALGIMAVEGIAYAHRYLFSVPAEVAVPQTRYRAVLAADKDLYRVAPIGGMALNFGWAGPFDLELVTGYDPFNLGHYQRYLQFLMSGRWERVQASNWLQLWSIARPDLLDALNVKYLLSTEELVSPRLELVGRWPAEPMWAFDAGLVTGPVYLYRNRRFLRRAFFPAAAVEVADEEAMQVEMARRDLRETAVVLTGAPGGGAERRATQPEAAEPVVRAVDAGLLEVTVTAQQARYLLISQVWHRGWQATLDGRPYPLLRADMALMAAWVPAGTHRLVLRYRPPLFGVGCGISAVALVGLLLWLGFILRATPLPVPPAPSTLAR